MLGFDGVKLDAEHVTFKVNQPDSLFDEIFDGTWADGAFHCVGSVRQQFSVVAESLKSNPNIFDWDVIVVDDSNPADRRVENPKS